MMHLSPWSCCLHHSRAPRNVNTWRAMGRVRHRNHYSEHAFVVHEGYFHTSQTLSKPAKAFHQGTSNVSGRHHLDPQLRTLLKQRDNDATWRHKRPPTTSSKMAVTANNFPNRKCKTITLNVAVRVPDSHSPVDSGWLWVTVGVPGGLLQWCIRQVAIVYQNAMNWKITCYTDDRPVSPPFSRCRA